MKGEGTFRIIDVHSGNILSAEKVVITDKPKKIEDATAYNDQQADVAYRFLPCMCAGLAYYLSMKKAPDRIQAMKLIYEDELKRALEEDGQRTSLYVSPQSYFPNVS